MPKLEAGGQVVEAAAVLFDKDCTLIDSAAIWPDLVERRVARLGELLPLAPKLVPVIYRAIGLKLPERRPIPRSPLALGPRRDTIVAVATVLFLEGVDWDAALEAVQRAFQLADEETERTGGADAFPEARPLLAALRRAGFRIGVLTNDDRERAAQTLARVGLGDLVEAVAGGDEVKSPKPDPAILQLLCRKLDLAPKDCVVVGDALSDIRMGLSAGVRLTVGVTTGSATRSEFDGLAGAVVSSLGEIRPLP